VLGDTVDNLLSVAPTADAVGVGTAAPDELFHVSGGNAKIQNDAEHVELIVESNSATGWLAAPSTDATGAPALGIHSADGIELVVDEATTPAVAGTFTSTELTIPRVRLTATTDVSHSSTAHGFQIGPDDGPNL